MTLRDQRLIIYPDMLNSWDEYCSFCGGRCEQGTPKIRLRGPSHRADHPHPLSMCHVCLLAGPQLIAAMVRQRISDLEAETRHTVMVLEHLATLVENEQRWPTLEEYARVEYEQRVSELKSEAQKLAVAAREFEPEAPASPAQDLSALDESPF